MKKKLFSFLLLIGGTMLSEDWPTYGHDNFQSRISRSKVDLTKMSLLWENDSSFRPQPAWAGSAIQDFYDNKGIMLKDMRDYDLSDGLIYFDGKLVVTSSARNSLYCYDVATGAEIWNFTAGGPIRVSATYNRGDIYFGSDDGKVYCLNADTGIKKWSYSPGNNTDHREFLQNGKIVSTMPCRTGVTVVGNTAYCGFSFLPWKKSYFCAVDAISGKEIYSAEHSNITMEGPFAYSSGRVIASMGRLAPKVFNAADGSILATMPNGGGSYLIVSPNREVIHAPGHQGGWVETTEQNKTLLGQVSRSDKSSAASDKGSIFRLNSALKAVIDNRLVYAVSDSNLTCIDRLNNNSAIWDIPFDCHYSIIMAGKILFLGGDNQIKAVDAKTGAVLGTASVKGKVHNLIAGDGYVFASTNEGVVYSFHQGDSSSFSSPAAHSANVIPPGNATLKSGPTASFTGKNQVTISWTTETTETSAVNYGIGTAATATSSEGSAKTSHSIVIDNMEYNKKYVYNITTSSGNTSNYELNTFFNFQKNDLSTNKELLNSPTNLKIKAEKIKADSGFNHGIALVVGLNSGELVYNLAKNNQLHVIAIDTDAQKVSNCRQKLHNNKSYGSRITVNSVSDYDSLSWPDQFANIICSENSQSPVNGSFIKKYLNPYHGIAYVDDNWSTEEDLDLTAAASLSMKKATNPVPADFGKWNALYGSVDNTAFNNEGLGGAGATNELQVQWIGRPGPLHQADRNGRKTSPLAQNGILYIEGLQRIIAMDAKNGCVLWHKEIPGFSRMNTPRDSSNYVCDNSHVYLAVKDSTYKINGYSGVIESTIKNVTDSKMNPGKSWKYDWSYIASIDNLLIGSSVKEGTAYTNYKGGGTAGWYDSATNANVVSKVCSENIFALSKDSPHTLQWQYFNDSAVIINPTITIAEGKIVFIESREADRKSADSRRLNSLDKELYLICLDQTTGIREWEQQLNVVQGITMTNVSSHKGKIVLNMSNNWKYYIYSYNITDGSFLWTNSDIGWMKYSHHGKHMARPAIVDNKIYVRPGIVDLDTGTLFKTTNEMYGGCGTYSCTSNGLFFRSSSISFYNFANDSKSNTWHRLRPDCWLSMIPACGMLLAPEGGGGCDCDAGWLESSIAFSPLNRAEISFKYSNNTFYGQSYNVDILNLKHRNYDIRYTLDGAEPDNSSPIYSAPLTITASTTVKAALFKGNLKVSNVITQNFEKK